MEKSYKKKLNFLNPRLVVYTSTVPCGKMCLYFKLRTKTMKLHANISIKFRMRMLQTTLNCLNYKNSLVFTRCEWMNATQKVKDLHDFRNFHFYKYKMSHGLNITFSLLGVFGTYFQLFDSLNFLHKYYKPGRIYKYKNTEIYLNFNW